MITEAIYGNRKAFKNRYELEERKDDLALQVIDVTLPLNFLINNSGHLKVYFFLLFLSTLFLCTLDCVSFEPETIASCLTNLYDLW